MVDITPVPISHIWHHIKFKIFGLYPEAIGMSVRISKEQTHLGTSEPAVV